MMLNAVLTSLLVPLLVSALPQARSTPRPLVLWHGLGDSYASPGMLEFVSLIKEQHPGIFVHSVYMDEDDEEDKKAGFYGYANDQIALAAEQIANITELKDGFDAIGLSQGGQFLRAYVEFYNDPPVHNLITFGSQHMGISDIPACKPWDVFCQIARRLAKGAVYGEWAQSNLVQAQYYRDPRNYDAYLEASTFLALLNNEVEGKRNETYAKNFASLDQLVLVIFTQDTTVVPSESSWFGAEPIENETLAVGAVYADKNGQTPLAASQASSKTDDKTIIPMRLQPLYIEDWIGLRKLDEAGKVAFEACEGPHMQMNGCWKDISRKYIGQAV